MDYVRLGSTGLKVSRICLGMMSYSSKPWREWTLDYESAEPIVRRAIDLGVTFFDTADMYSLGGSEEVTGKLLRTHFDRGLLARPRSAEGTVRSGSDPFARELYQSGTSPADAAVIDAVSGLASARGVPNAQVALAWLLRQPAVTAPIVGATKLGHVEDAVAAVALELSDDEAALLETPYAPHAVAGHS